MTTKHNQLFCLNHKLLTRLLLNTRIRDTSHTSIILRSFFYLDSAYSDVSDYQITQLRNVKNYISNIRNFHIHIH